MIGFGELFKIFIIIIVVFLTLLMFIYICKKARGVFTDEYTKTQDYKRTEKTRKHERSMEDRKNLMHAYDRTAQSFDNTVDGVGKEIVTTVGESMKN